MKLQDHPLWRTICEWTKASPSQIVPFAPKSEFQQNIDKAVMVDPRWGHANAKKTFWDDFQYAACLGKALVGGPYDLYVHASLYRILSHPLGGALCLAAKHANLNPNWFIEFSESTRLDGFVIALEAWAKHFLQGEFNGKEQLPWVVKNLVGADELAADFWLTACQQSICDTAEFGKAFAKEIDRTGSAVRMKKRRERKPKRWGFRDQLQCLWVPAALWCRSNEEIVSILAPERTEDMIAAYERVARDVSDLGFSSSRRKSSRETEANKEI